MRFTSKIFPSRKGNLGILELNNGKALHALTIDMIHCMNDVWDEWMNQSEEQRIKAILLKSSTDECRRPSFCSGGDVKAVCEDGMRGGGDANAIHGYGIPGLLTSDFFRDEYTLNYKMAINNKTGIPQISIWNGIVMGGGTGISMHGRYRIATEHTIFAMPETAIGLFCDVGSLWWMSRLLERKKGFAPYIALTGARLKADDLLYTGLATHYVPSNKLSELEDAIVNATEQIDDSSSIVPYNDIVAPVLQEFHEIPSSKTAEGFLQKHESIIEKTFYKGVKSVEDVISNLEEHQKNDKSNESFCQTALDTLLTKSSPTSLKVVLEGLYRSQHSIQSIEEEFEMEYRISQAFMKNTNETSTDFYRGVRTILIDKSKEPPIWLPSKLENVTNDMVESYFTTLGEHDWKAPIPNESSSKL